MTTPKSKKIKASDFDSSDVSELLDPKSVKAQIPTQRISKKARFIRYFLALSAISFAMIAVLEVLYAVILLFFSVMAFETAMNVRGRILFIILAAALVSYPFVVVGSIFLADKALNRGKFKSAITFALSPGINILVIYIVMHLS